MESKLRRQCQVRENDAKTNKILVEAQIEV